MVLGVEVVDGEDSGSWLDVCDVDVGAYQTSMES